jgi:hypothetical protein
MKFSGRLQIEADPREWLKTDLSLAQGRLELTSGSELLGSWSMSQVKAERVEGDRFALLLGDDRALFAADDALAFSYEALPHLSKKHIIAGPTGLRGRLRNSLRGSERQLNEPQPEKPADVVQAPQAAGGDGGNGTSPTHPVARRLRELMEAASKEQASQQETLRDAPQNGAPPIRATELADDGATEAANHKATEPASDGVMESALIFAVAEEAADVSEVGLIEPVSTLEPEAAESAWEEPAPDWWPKTALVTPAPTAVEMTSPTQPHAIRLDLEPAFARVRSTDDEEPEDKVMSALEGVLAEVREGALSPPQVSAVTALVQAVTDLVAARRSSSKNS